MIRSGVAGTGVIEWQRLLPDETKRIRRRFCSSSEREVEMRTGSFRAMVAAAAVALSLGVSACGDDKSSNSSPAPIPAPQVNVENVVACDLVTQEDATKLFGQPASNDEEELVADPALGSQCDWAWASPDNDSQLIQILVWNGQPDLYYSEIDEVPGAQALDIGDRGHITVTGGSLGGVEIEWLQDGKTVDITYSTYGNGVPDPADKVEELKALAQQASDRM